MKKGKIAIVGAGISGLTCAYELQKLGFDPVIFEKESTPGGRMKTYVHKGLIFDSGTQVFDENYSKTRKLFEELGLNKEKKWGRISKSVSFNFYTQEKFVSLGHLFTSFCQLPCPSFFSKVRFLLFLIYLNWKSKRHFFFDLCKKGRNIETISAKEYLCKNIHPEIVENLLNPILYAVTGISTEDLNLSCFLEIFHELKKHRYKMYHLEKGMRSLYEALSKKVEIKTKNKVEKVIACGEQGVEIVTQNGAERYDAVILAIPAPFAHEIYQNPSPIQKRILERSKYKSCIVVGYEIPLKPLEDHPLTLFPYKESPLINSCLIPHLFSKHEKVTAKTRNTMSVFLYEETSQELMKLSDKEVSARVLAELMKVLPILKPYVSEIELIAAQKWACSLPRYYQNYTVEVRDFWQCGQGEQNVYFSSDYLNAPFIEGSIRSALKVVNQIHLSLSEP